MKKTSIFLFSLLCAAALSMTACGSEKIVDEQPEENSVAVTEEEAVEETEEVTYYVTLDHIKSAVGSSEGLPYAIEVLVNENGDMYDAWNILQIAMFGEVIYG